MKFRVLMSLKQKCLTLLIIITLFTTSFSGITLFGIKPVKADSEPNNNFIQAEAITLNSTKFGSVNASDIEDYWYSG